MPFHLRGYPAQVAIRPDTPYDESGVFSGSATVVDGVPVLSYSVENQQVMAFAVPADLSDPLFTKWSKPAYNPVMRYAEVANITDEPIVFRRGALVAEFQRKDRSMFTLDRSSDLDTLNKAMALDVEVLGGSLATPCATLWGTKCSRRYAQRCFRASCFCRFI